MNYEKRLLGLIIDRVFKYSDTPSFTLASGLKSKYYFNCKQVTLDPEGRLCIGEMAYNLLSSTDFDAVGGLTLGADPIAIAISDAFFRRNRHITSFVVRKEPKKHGTSQWIEGVIKKGSLAVIAEDVITTGQSTIKAIQRALECGLKVAGVIAVIDREEGGQNAIEELGFSVKSLFRRSEIVNACNKY